VAFKIQRVPRGLGDVLSIFGGQTPTDLSEQVGGVLELLQFYGLQQRQLLTNNNAALVEGGQVTIFLPNFWCVLFMANMAVIKTATMTALRGGVFLSRAGGAAQPGACYLSEEMGPFGATETGQASLAFVPPYPMLMPPGSTVTAIPLIIGTDANANVFVGCEIGLLG
jgi:hypothetical protein